MDIIKDCLVTQSDAKILKKYCVDKSSELYRKYKSYNTSVNLSASKVYSMCYGVVSHLSGDKKHGYEIGIRVNGSQAVKYGNLKSVNVRMNDVVDITQELGEANRYVSIEYLTTNLINPYTYRIGSTQMYKDDPMKILEVDTSELQSTSSLFSQSGIQDIMEGYDGGDDNYADNRTPTDYAQY